MRRARRFGQSAVLKCAAVLDAVFVCAHWSYSRVLYPVDSEYMRLSNTWEASTSSSSSSSSQSKRGNTVFFDSGIKAASNYVCPDNLLPVVCARAADLPGYNNRQDLQKRSTNPTMSSSWGAKEWLQWKGGSKHCCKVETRSCSSKQSTIDGAAHYSNALCHHAVTHLQNCNNRQSGSSWKRVEQEQAMLCHKQLTWYHSPNGSSSPFLTTSVALADFLGRRTRPLLFFAFVMGCSAFLFPMADAVWKLDIQHLPQLSALRMCYASQQRPKFQFYSLLYSFRLLLRPATL